MGVPKFYRWISERYPQINQIISDNTLIPEIDNLYLDMNGILHACSHPNDDDPSAKALTFKEMIQNIFSYIDRIVSEIVKPKKVLLMVIDGVAPRAKLNQQRSRRFRAAQDRVENMEKLRAKGERVDEESAFDSNCITPGTDFMDQVSKHLKWFIRKKIKEDLLWRNLEIVFSGHDVPGEGEHKIMQYLREKRAMPNYQPNIRHCMYGQDADLIMLGLATHEPHFALVREVVNFNSFKKGASARQTVMRNTKEAQFQLLHLSILREYIESDFGLGIEETETFKIDKERLVDDFIFLTFFVGNDFLPHLPTLDISENAFDVVFNAYKFVVSKTHSYFVQNGEIADFDQIETFCQIIGKQEQEILSTRESEDKRTLAKRSKYRDFKPQHTQNELDEMEESLQTHYESAVVESSLAKLTVVQASAQVKVRNNIYSHLVENYFNEDGGDDEDFDYDPDAETEAEVGTGGVGDYEDNQLNVGEENDSDNVEGFVTVSKNKDKGKSAPPTTTAPAKKFAGKDYRGRYYFDKFKQLPSDSSDATLNDDFLKELIAHYLEGLIWCVAYYMKGCISWTWYYPYHYGPMLQDMKNLKQVAQTIDFKLGTPFLPFQQLLGCLPPASKKLLPAAYQWIMTSADSPCFQFYPKDFAIDMTHKKNPWEAVVLLPFIDEKVLLATEIQYCNQNLLTAQEKVRNSFGTTHVHTYNPNVTETYFSNSVDQGFSDIMCCQSSVQQVETSLAPGEFFQSKLIEGTKPFLPGFPTLTSLRLLKVELSAVQVNVFGSESKYKSLLVEVDSMREKIEQQLVELQSSDTAVKTSSEKKFMALLGKSVYVNYPQLHEAKIVAVTTEGKEIRADFNHASNSVSNPRVIPYDHITSQKWAKDSMEEQSRYFKGRGSPGSGGLIIGQVLIRLRVVALQGMKTDLVTGERRKVFGRSETDIPIQLVLWNHLHDPRFVETDKLPLTSLFPNRCEVVGIKGDCLGIKGYVVHTDGKADNGDDLKGTATSRQSLQQEHAQGKKKASTTSGPDMRLVDVEFLVPDSVEPQFGHVIAKSMQEPYVSSKEVCKILNISPDLLGKIVGSIAADPGRHDLGLNLKRNGQHQLLGYVRRVENGYSSSASAEKSTVPNVWKQADKVKLVGSVEPSVPAVTEQVSAQWEYTIQATELLADYKAKFPMLFQNLARLPHKPKYMLSELLGKDAEKTLDSIMEWMKGQISFHLPRTLLTTSALPKEAMKAIEKASDMRMAYLQTSPPELKMLKQVPVDAIFRGDMFSPFDAPLNLNGDNVPMLGDRVTNLTSVGVPFGLKGTVVIVHSSTGYVEVIFDEEFIGGRSLQGNCSQFRGRLCPWSGLLRIPNTQLKTQQQNSRSVSSAQINSYSVSSVKQTTNMPIQSNSGFNSHSSLASATVVLKSSSRPTSSVAASTPSVPVNTQQAAKLVSLLKGNKTDIVKNDAEQKGKRNEQVNPEKSKSILNMLNAPIATEKPIPVHQSESKTSLLKSALFSSTVAVDEEVEGQTGQVEVNATVELKSLLAVDTCEEVHIDGSVAVVSTSPVKKEKKATMLVPSKVQIKKKA